MSRRITDAIASQIEDAIERHAQGDEVIFDVTMLPGQDGAPGLFIAFYMPGLVLGQQIHAGLMTGNAAGITQEVIDRITHDLLEALRAERTKQATAAMSSPVPGSNGHGPTVLQTGS